MADVEKQVPVNGDHARPKCNIANSGPLGLYSFATTTFILSLYNAGTRHIASHNVVVGMALFAGGLAQLLAGMWAFPRNDRFAATALTSYGAFWMSFATILIPGSGIIDAYKGKESEFENAVGIYLITWMMITFCFLLGALKKNITFVALFTFLTVTFMALAIGAFMANAHANKAGGALGIITGLIAFYAATAELLGDDWFFELPMGKL